MYQVPTFYRRGYAIQIVFFSSCTTIRSFNITFVSITRYKSWCHTKEGDGNLQQKTQYILVYPMEISA